MRQPKRAGFKVPPLPIKAEEVAGWFRACCRGAAPDQPTCTLIAEVFTNHVGFFTPDRTREARYRAVQAAASLLLKELDHDGPIGTQLAELVDALKAAKPFLHAPLLYPAKMAPWASNSPMVWEVIAEALEEIGHAKGRNRNSIAVKITALALKRMGYAGATGAALEMSLRRLPTD